MKKLNITLLIRGKNITQDIRIGTNVEASTIPSAIKKFLSKKGKKINNNISIDKIEYITINIR